MFKLNRFQFSISNFQFSIFLLLACTIAATSPVPTDQTISMPVVDLPRRDAVRLVITGDIGADPSRVARAIGRFHSRTPIDAIVLLGDNFYDCGVRSTADPQWRKIRDHYSPIGVPLYPVLGNHDYGNPKGAGSRIAVCGDPDPKAQIQASKTVVNWNFPAHNYVVRTGLADVFLVDTTPLARRWSQSFRGSPSSGKTLSALAENLRRSTARWKIVAGHHTIRASGTHGWDDRLGEGLMQQVQILLLENNVDLYAAGHDHHMELISFEETDPKQPIYLISGAGSRLREIVPKSRTGLPTLFPPDAKSFLGFALVEVSADALAISFYDTEPRQRGRFRFER